MKNKKILSLILVMVIVLSFVLVACDDGDAIDKTVWGETTYEFAEDGSSCIAKRVDSKDPNNIQTATAKIIVAITKPATFTEKGERTYTATFKEEWAKTQSKTIANVPVYTLSHVEAKDATVNEEGNIEYYVGTNDKFYLDEAHTQEISFEETILRKIPTVKVEKVEAQYGKNGVKEYYKDAQNNKYLMNDKNLLEKIKSEDDLVITELLGKITLYVNGVKLESTIEHKKSQDVVDADITKLVMDVDNPDCEGYKMYSDEALTKEITNITEFAKENKDPSIYVAKTYLLSLELNGGTNEGNKTSVEIRWNGKYKDFIPTTTKEGYELEGWYTKAEGGTKIDVESIVKNEKHTIYANYTIKTNTITFNSNGGSAIKSISGEYNTTITEPTDPTYEDHTFEGWFSDADFKKEFTFTTMPASSITLYAKWKLNYHEGLAFEEIEGGLEVSGYTGKDLAITIPSVAKGNKPVIAIGQYAFSTHRQFGDANNNDQITSINMPSVTKVDWGAFYNCNKLQSVTLGENDVTLRGEAFSACSSLNEIVNHANITDVGSDALSSTKLTQLSFPKLVELSDSLFSWCTELSSISIPNVKTIGNNTFYKCTKLNTIELGTLNYISVNSFRYVPATLELVMSEGARIEGNAFNNANLKSIELNDKVNNDRIDGESFKGLTSIECIKAYYGSRIALMDSTYLTIGKLELKATSQEPIELDQNRFMGLDNVTTLVSNEVYNKANWNAIDACNPANMYLNLDFKNGTFATNWVNQESTSKVYAYSEKAQTAIMEEIDGYWFIKDGKITLQDGDYIEVSLIGPENVSYEVVGGSRKIQSLEIPDTYFGKNIDQIAAYAFISNQNITSVKLGRNITKVGNLAFNSCINLQTVDLAGVISLGASSFNGCGIRELVINCLSECADSIFASNIELTKVTFNGMNIDISNATNMFRGCEKLDTIELPETTTIIPHGMFNSCTALKNITIPINVEKIDDCAFENCTSLNTINMGNCDRLTAIGSSVFNGCTSLEKIELNEGLTSIGASTFTNMPALSTVIIPESLTSIMTEAGNSTFGDGLTYLNRLYFKGLNKDNLQVYNSLNNYQRYLYNIDVDRRCIQKDLYDGTWGKGQSGEILINNNYIVLEGNKIVGTKNLNPYDELSIKVPKEYKVYTNGVKSTQAIEIVGDDVFADITNLGTIKFNNQIKSIGARAFKGCTNLKEVTNIGNTTLLEIKEETFKDCTNLFNVTSIVAVQNIGVSAFENCKAIGNINLENLTNVGDRAFAGSNIKNLIVYNAKLGANMLDGAVVGTFNQTNNDLDASIDTVLTNATIEIAKITPNLAPQVKNMISCQRIVLQGSTTLRANQVVQAPDTLGIVISKDITTLEAGCIGDTITCKVYLEHTQVPANADSNWYQSAANKVYIYNEALDVNAHYDQAYITGVWKARGDMIQYQSLIK